MRAAFDFTQPINALVAADEAFYSRQGGQINQGSVQFSVSCVPASQSESAWFMIESGVCQGCELAPDSFYARQHVML